MKHSVKSYKTQLKNNIYIGNMADFESLESPLKEDYSTPFEQFDMESVSKNVRRYSLEEYDFDWNNERDLDINFNY